MKGNMQLRNNPWMKVNHSIIDMSLQNLKMKTVAIVAEYNPFHNGHLYQINQVREQLHADCIIVIMSGNFVQRGTPAMIDKYSRTKIALIHGADIVFELPLYYATASAELFAYGAINILNSLGTVDYLCFGSECGDVSILRKIAEILIKEPKEYSEALKNYLKSGLSYPMARNEALLDYLGQDKTISEIIKQPNNILGIEYIKALLRLNSNITPYTFKRIGSGYHDKSLENIFCSASAIRNFYKDIQHNSHISIEHFVPTKVNDFLSNSYSKLFPITEEDLSTLIYYRLLLETKSSLLQYLDVTSELSNRIFNELDYRANYAAFVNKFKTKQYTYTRVERALLHIVLGITTENMTLFKNSTDSCYARVLGFRKNAAAELKRMQKEGTCPLVNKVADAKKNLSKNAMQCLEADIMATHLYNKIVYQKFGTSIKNEYQIGPFIHDFSIE